MQVLYFSQFLSKNKIPISISIFVFSKHGASQEKITSLERKFAMLQFLVTNDPNVNLNSLACFAEQILYKTHNKIVSIISKCCSHGMPKAIQQVTQIT